MWNGQQRYRRRRIACAGIGLLMVLAAARMAVAGSIFDDDGGTPARPATRPAAVPPAPPPPPAAAPSTPIHPPRPATPPAPIEPIGPMTVPSSEDQAKARAMFEQKYAKQLDDHAPASRMALSEQLVQDAADPASTPAERYVILIGARKAGIESHDLPTAIAADNALCDAFAVNAPASRLDLLKRISDADLSPDQRGDLAKTALAQVDAAMNQDQFDVAAQLAFTAVTAARRSDDSDLLQKAIASEKKVRSIADVYDRIAASLAALKKDPANPDANLAVGRFYCFIAGQWETGLPHLAVGPKGALAHAATLDLAGEDPLAIADQWKAQIDRVATAERPQVRLRAIKWFKKALDSLNGDEKAKVQDELSALDDADVYGAAVDLMPSMTGRFAAHSDGLFTIASGDRIFTKQEFTPPIAFRIVARTDSTNIRIGYACDQMIFNWENDPNWLRIDGGPADGRHKRGAGRVPINTWATIDLVVLRDSMSISVDGHQRYFTRADFSHVKQHLSIFENARSIVQVKAVSAARPQ